MNSNRQRRGLPGIRHGLGLAVLLVAVPLQAQKRSTDRELEALIPDSAIEQPEDWAKGENSPPPAAGEAPRPAGPDNIDPAAPLTELPAPAVAWPADLPALPEIESLEPEPDLQLAAQDEPEAEQPVGGDRWELSDGVELAFPVDDRQMPVKRRIATRFANLSTLLTLEGGAEDNIAQIAVRARSDRQLLLQLLRVYGYYDGQVIQTVSGITPGEEVAAAGTAKVRFDIVPGTRYRVGVIDLGGLDSLGADLALMRDNYVIQPGDFVSSDAIVDERLRLDTALGEGGYPFAKLEQPELLIDHAREQGDITQVVAPGGKYNFGLVTSSDPDFLSGNHFAQIARFHAGELYRRSVVDDLRRAILATGLVTSVELTPRQTAPAVGDAPGVVALDVTFARAPLRTLAAAAGYDSGDGFRVEGSWEHRNLFPPEGLLRLRGVLGTREQLAGVTFRRNNFRRRDQVLTLDFTADNVNRDAYAARTLSLTGSIERLTTILFRKPLTWAAGFEVLVSDEREAKVAGGPTTRLTYTVAALPLRIAFDGSNDFLDPSRGIRAALRVSPELSFQSGRTSQYARIQGDVSYYYPVTSSTVLAARLRLGTIPGTELSGIAPSRRFYAGGGGSVRGYGYQGIGPRDALGDPSGGRSLNEFSLEARVRTPLFGGAVSLVPFIDAGSVEENALPRFRDLRFGAGLGLRWATGFGPIRIDVATPLGRRADESLIAVYVALGQAF